MTETTYFGLKKPDDTDSTDQRPFNDNADIIDEALHDRYTKEESREQHQTLAGAITKNRNALIELVDGGAKNVLQFDGMSSPSGSADNITFTYNSDGSITVNGYTTDAGTAYVYLRFNGSNINADEFCNGNFVLSGCPVNDSGLSLQARGTDYTKSDNGSGVELTEYSGSGAVRITVMVAKNSTIDNLTIRPMICSKAAWDISQTYQPYRPSYQELYERVLALEGGT